MGRVEGTSIFNLGKGTTPKLQGKLVYTHPIRKSRHVLELVKSEPEGEPGEHGLIRKVKLTFFDKNPPSGAGADTDDTVLPVRPGLKITARLEGEKSSISVVESGNDKQFILTLTAPETPIANASGEWEYFAGSQASMAKSRAGAFDKESGKVSGDKTWSRQTPSILSINHTEGRSPSEVRAAAWRLKKSKTPLKLPEYEGSYGDIWLSVVGLNLPVEAERTIEVSFGPGGNKPTQTEKPDKKPNYELVRFLHHRRNPTRPTVLDIRVAMDTGIDHRPIRITINGASGIWKPQASDEEPLVVRFVRAQSSTVFNPIREVYPGDVVYIEAIYKSPPTIQPKFEIRGSAAAKSPRVSLTADHSAGSEGMALYRSSRILVLEKSMPSPSISSIGSARETGLDAVPAIVLRGETAKRLIAAEIDSQPSSVGKKIGRVLLTDPPASLWEKAVLEARACRAGGAATEVTRIIVTNLLSKERSATRSVKISPLDYAAALLLKREFERSLGRYARDLDFDSGISSSLPLAEQDKRRKALAKAYRSEAMQLIGMAQRGYYHPLFNQRVSTVGLQDGKLFIDPNVTQRLNNSLFPVYFNEIWKNHQKAFLNYATTLITDAKESARLATIKSKNTSQSTDSCDPEAVFKLVGVGTDAIVQGVIPRLLRRRTGDEPAYPAWRTDKIAVAAVLGVRNVAGEIAAQDSLARTDRDVVMAAAMIASGGLGALAPSLGALVTGAKGSLAATRLLQLSGAVVTAGDLYEVALIGSDTQGWVDARDDEKFGLGIEGVAGEARIKAAQARQLEKLIDVLTAAGATIGGTALGGITNGFKFDVPASVKDAIGGKVLRKGVDSLRV